MTDKSIEQVREGLEYAQTSLPPYKALSVLNFPGEVTFNSAVYMKRVVRQNLPPVYFV